MTISVLTKLSIKCYNFFMAINKIKFNWPLVGNDHIIEFLTKSIVKKSISGSYIFYGPDNLGKTTVANYFARSLICTGSSGVLPCGQCPACLQSAKGIYGDIFLIKQAKDKKNISIDQVREFIHNLNLTSFLNSYKIGIIKHAENLSEEAYHALLKTLEEPKLKVVIILITSHLEVMPLTIISRSQLLKFKLVKADIIYDYLIKQYKASRSAAKNFSRLALGRPALAVKFFANKEFLENYSTRIETLLKILSTDDYIKRFNLIKDLTGEPAAGQEAVRLSWRLIEIWLGLIRDLILIKSDQTDLIQHHLFQKEIEKIKGNFNIKNLIEQTATLKQAQEYIKANVNPRLVLEDVAISI